MEKVLITLTVVCALSTSVLGKRSCSYEDILKKAQACRSNSGFDIIIDESGGNTIKTACRDGRMQRFSNCVRMLASECGITRMFDYDRRGKMVAKLCQDVRVLNNASQCIREREADKTSCTNSMLELWKEYVKSESSEPDSDATVLCNMFGGAKKCFRDAFEPCDKKAVDMIIWMYDAFTPSACQNFHSCEVCGAGKTATVSALIISFVFVVKQIVF